MKELFVITSNEKNVYKNLASESCMLNYASKFDAAFLFFWKNNSTVVIGRHQNPYTECDLKYAEENEIKIARRITGGGAVYHNYGNINFTFIFPRNCSCKNGNDIILKALNKAEINAVLSGRNDILVNNGKISGNAYLNTRYAHLHHGTILINMSLENAANVLTPNKYKFLKNSVRSVKSRIINLKEINKNINAELLKEKITEATLTALEGEYKDLRKEFNPCKEEFEKLYKKYSSKNWIYSKYGDFEVKICKIFNWGTLEVGIDKKEKIRISTDAINSRVIGEIIKHYKSPKKLIKMADSNEDKIVIKNILQTIKLMYNV